jgi:hypothetical protein
MSNAQNKRGRSRKQPPFVMLPWYVIDCIPWRSLTFAASAAFIQVARLYNGWNNGQLGLAASTLAERMGCSKATAARALNELETTGFIGVQKVGIFRRKDRLASEYFLTLYKNDVNGDLPSKAFMRWRPQQSQEK